MRIVLISVLGLFLGGCVPKTADIPQPPTVTQSAVEDFKKTQDGIDTSVISNKKIQEKIKTQQETITEQKVDIAEAIAQVEKIKQKIREQIQISEAETFVLVEQLKKIETRNLFLETKTKELSNANEEQLKVLEETKKYAEDTFQKLVLVENEALELRRQNMTMAKSLQAKNDEVLALNKKLADAQVYKKWVIGMVVAFVLYILIGIALKYIKPL